MVALLIKSSSGPSQPDLGGKERGAGERGREKRVKVGKGRKKRKISVTTQCKMCHWGFKVDAFKQEGATLSTSVLLLTVTFHNRHPENSGYVEKFEP